MFTTLKLFVEQLQRFKLFVHIEFMQTSISEHDQCEDISTKFCVKYKNDGGKKMNGLQKLTSKRVNGIMNKSQKRWYNHESYIQTMNKSKNDGGNMKSCIKTMNNLKKKMVELCVELCSSLSSKEQIIGFIWIYKYDMSLHPICQSFGLDF